MPTGDSTRRFAVLSMDWDKIKAVDLLALFQSFAPSGGAVLSVAIYPSEYGKERMVREDRFGPQAFGKHKAAAHVAATAAAHDDELDEVSAGIKPQEGDAEKEVDYNQLRRYQIERLRYWLGANGRDWEVGRETKKASLQTRTPCHVGQTEPRSPASHRYFFAVVECDSVATADTIYDQCDGLEYEGSANMLDLRFVPDDVSYKTDTPRDVATAVPAGYKPIPFETKACSTQRGEVARLSRP